MIGEIIVCAMFVCLLIGLVTGHPLAFVLGGVGAVAGYIGWGTSIFSVLTIRIYDAMSLYSTVAIPMFVLMAAFLTQSKVADGLFDSIRYLFGPVKGGLGIAVIAVATVFAATTGIIGASVVTMGMLGIPVLLKHGYKEELAVGCVMSGGTLGILIPPSIMLVLMGTYSNVSVGKLFLAALLPGLTLSAGYMIYTFVVCQIHPEWGPAMSKEELAEMPLGQRIKGSLVNLVPPLILIIGVLGSIFGGIATPTEAAGVGAFVAMIMCICYGKFSLQVLKDSLLDTVKTSAMCFAIVFGANTFTSVFMALDGDEMIANFVSSLGLSGWGVFAAMMILVFILGMFIDWLGIIMLTFSIFLPILDTFGFDRLYVVATTAVLLQTSFLTPPFGYALFYVKSLVPPYVTMKTIYKAVIPFVIIMLLVVLLTIFWPGMVLLLPSMSSL